VTTELYMEMQRLRRIERLLIKLKSVTFRPLPNNTLRTLLSENQQHKDLLAEALNEVKSPWKSDEEAMGAVRKSYCN
jgi:hypothetical protein